MKLLSIMLALVVAVLSFFHYFQPVYGDCKQTIEGRVCTLQGWEKK